MKTSTIMAFLFLGVMPALSSASPLNCDTLANTTYGTVMKLETLATVLGRNPQPFGPGSNYLVFRINTRAQFFSRNSVTTQENFTYTMAYQGPYTGFMRLLGKEHLELDGIVDGGDSDGGANSDLSPEYFLSGYHILKDGIGTGLAPSGGLALMYPRYAYHAVKSQYFEDSGSIVLLEQTKIQNRITVLRNVNGKLQVVIGRTAATPRQDVDLTRFKDGEGLDEVTARFDEQPAK